MAIVTRYFSTAAAGAGDGTSWADRAALFSGGAWSTIITGFNFSGSDSLLCLIGPGTYSISAQLLTTIFANPPTVANALMLHGCDSSGAILSPPDPFWTADQPGFDDSTFPVLETTTNITTIANFSQTAFIRCLKFTASGVTNRGILGSLIADWIVVECSSPSNTSSPVSSFFRFTNSIIRQTGATYDSVYVTNGTMDNIRIEGVTGSSGNRDGIAFTSTSGTNIISRVYVAGCGGHGFSNRSTNVSNNMYLIRSTFVNNGGDGIRFASVASQTNIQQVVGCVVVGNGGYGINYNTNAHVLAYNNRVRNNTSGQLLFSSNRPDYFGNETSAGTDADEFVDATNGDYRIKAGSSLWGKGYGVADEYDSPDNVALAVWTRLERSLTG
jgi:hypothetical protein